MARHRTDIQIRFADTDALGHLNNAAYATYAELGRLMYFETIGGLVNSLILAHLSIDYRRQVRFGEPVFVESVVEKVGNSSFTLRQQVFGAGQVAADITAIVVYFDYAAQRPKPIPAELRVKLESGMEPRPNV